MELARITDEIQGVVSSIGRAFLFASYLPAALFFALNEFVLLPAVGVDPASQFGSLLPEGALSVADLIMALVAPFFLAILLVSMNTSIIKFFEGLFPWQRRFLLRPLQRANERWSERNYGELGKLRREYRELLSGPPGVLSDEGGMPAAKAERLDELANRIQRMHERVEGENPEQTHPFRPRYNRPTALGNAFAVFEEYPLDRYGMDAVLYWPRLRQVVDDQLLGALDHQKMLLDFQLNLSLLGLILGLVGVVLGILQQTWIWGLLAAVALMLARLSYSAAVRVVRSMGTLVNTCFDLYRTKLLEALGLSRPDTFYEEFVMWLRLGAFMRRGEIFYRPQSSRRNPGEAA